MLTCSPPCCSPQLKSGSAIWPGQGARQRPRQSRPTRQCLVAEALVRPVVRRGDRSRGMRSCRSPGAGQATGRPGFGGGCWCAGRSQRRQPRPDVDAARPKRKRSASASDVPPRDTPTIRTSPARCRFRRIRSIRSNLRRGAGLHALPPPARRARILAGAERVQPQCRKSTSQHGRLERDRPTPCPLPRRLSQP